MGYTKVNINEDMELTQARLEQMETQYDEAIDYAIERRDHPGSQLRVEVLNSFPTHAEGRLIFHTDEGFFYVSINSTWRKASSEVILGVEGIGDFSIAGGEGGAGGDGGGNPSGLGIGGSGDYEEIRAGGLRGGGGGGGTGGGAESHGGTGGDRNTETDPGASGGSPAFSSASTDQMIVDNPGGDGSRGSGGGGGARAFADTTHTYASAGAGRTSVGGGAGGGGGGCFAWDSYQTADAGYDDNLGEFGGGVLVIIAYGSVVVNGAIYCRGGKGGSGGFGGGNVDNHGGGGGGGGSGGGKVLIIHRGGYANNGTISVAGGAGGMGGLAAYDGQSGSSGNAGDVQVVEWED